jgi:hypothetical protein
VLLFGEDVAHATGIDAVVRSNFMLQLSAPRPKPHIDSLIEREGGFSQLQVPFWLIAAG